MSAVVKPLRRLGLITHRPGPVPKKGEPCRCCQKPLSDRATLGEFCDAICYAAAKTLSSQGLKIWRLACWRLDIAPTSRLS